MINHVLIGVPSGKHKERTPMTPELWKSGGEWKDLGGIPEHKDKKGKYVVSSIGGMIVDVEKNNLLNHLYDKRGPKTPPYERVSICGVQEKVHYLVAYLFVPNLDPKKYIVPDHIDNNPSNNDASNLQWLTHIQNMAKQGPSGVHHLKIKGLFCYGYTLEGKFIGGFKTSTEAGRITGISKAITYCLIGRRCQAEGLIFKYADTPGLNYGDDINIIVEGTLKSSVINKGKIMSKKFAGKVVGDARDS